MKPLARNNSSLFASSCQPSFVIQRCLRTRLNTHQCQRCVENCSAGALKVLDRKISFEPSQCTSCMSCVAVCPQDALVSDFDIEKLLCSLHPARDVVISCVRQKQMNVDEITIPCVGIFSKQLLTASLLRGCRSIFFQLSGCADCPNGEISRAFKLTCQELFDVLEDLHPSTVVFREKEEQFTHHTMDRRAFLRKLRQLAGDISTNTLCFAPDSPPDDRARSRRVPSKTALIKKVLTNLDGDCQKTIIRLFAHSITLNDTCTCCPLCKGICPTGAITVDRCTEGKRLNFAMLDCNGCGLCVEFCKNNAISLI